MILESCDIGNLSVHDTVNTVFVDYPDRVGGL